MGKCKDCSYCQTMSSGGFIFSTTLYYCTNPSVVMAKGQGKYSHDVRVDANDSCNMYSSRPSTGDIGYRKG